MKVAGLVHGMHAGTVAAAGIMGEQARGILPT